MKRNIILVGFMGVGKGTVARALAAKMGCFALDTDDLIESFEKRKIKKIFDKHGEAYFRDLESRCAEWIEQSVQGSIISTGGGFFAQNNIKDLGIIVCLRSSFEAILQRIQESKNSEKKLAKRPLLRDKEKAKALFDQRAFNYEAIADLIIDVQNKKTSSIVEEIIAKVGQ